MTRANRSGTPVGPLLPAEPRHSDVLEDAEHWVAVYEELIRFLVEVQEPGCDRLGKFHRRLDYWRHRRDQLTP